MTRATSGHSLQFSIILTKLQKPTPTFSPVRNAGSKLRSWQLKQRLRAISKWLICTDRPSRKIWRQTCAFKF